MNAACAVRRTVEVAGSVVVFLLRLLSRLLALFEIVLNQFLSVGLVDPSQRLQSDGVHVDQRDPENRGQGAKDDQNETGKSAGFFDPENGGNHYSQ